MSRTHVRCEGCSRHATVHPSRVDLLYYCEACAVEYTMMSLRDVRRHLADNRYPRPVRRKERRMSEEHQRIVAQAIASLRVIMMSCTDEERLAIIEQVRGDYCRHCGSTDPRCQCWNDE